MTKPSILSACLLAAAIGSPLFAVEPAKPIFASDIIRHGDVAIDVDITGAKALYLVVGDGSDGYSCDWADWIDPVLTGPNGDVKLTDLPRKYGDCGWREPHDHTNINGDPMKVDGKSVDGIGVHAISHLVYDIEGKGFTRFKARGGADDGGTSQHNPPTSSMQFYVYTEKPPMDPTAPVSRLSPDDSVAAMEVAKGLAVTLWASEPMFSNPTDIDIDAFGRVWVNEGNNYRQWQHNIPAGDRIMVMDDPTGTGKATTARVFYQNNDVNAALGICVLGHQVIISDSPNVFLFTDNGEGKPPTKQLMFTGISGFQHDHGVHTFVFGPDGKLYFNFGNMGGQIHDKNDKPIIDMEGNEVNNTSHPYRQGMAFRCNMDGSQFEVLGHDFRNNYELCVDSFGTVFQSDNDDDGNRGTRINYVMEHGNFGYVDELTSAGWNDAPSMLAYPHPHETSDAQHDDVVMRHWHQFDPGVIPNLLNTGAGSPTGMVVYEGDLLPATFKDQLIHCEPGSNVVRSYQLTREGAGYKATILNILSSRDHWFRPSDVCVAPDGSLIVADWFDQGVGGHGMADNNPATSGGRLYRVAPPGHGGPLTKFDPATLSTAAGAILALCSPNLATRYLGWTALHDMKEAAEPELVALWKGDVPYLRARALWLLTKLPDNKGAAYVLQASLDSNPDIRITALRAARQINYPLIPLVQSLVHDHSAQVRRECAITLRHNPSSGMPPLWAELAQQQDGTDRWYIEALGIGADKRENECFTAWKNLVQNEWNTPGGREVVWRSRAKGVAALLSQLIRDPQTSPYDRQRYLRALDYQPADEREVALVELLGATGPNAEQIQGDAVQRIKNLDSPEAKEAIKSILEKGKSTPSFVGLIKRFKLPGYDTDLLTCAIANMNDASSGEAMQMLLDRDGGAALIKAALTGDTAAAAATALGNSFDERDVDMLSSLAVDQTAPLPGRQEAVRGLAKTHKGALLLVSLLKNQQIKPDLKALSLITLNNVTYPDVQAQLGKHAGDVPMTNEGKPLPVFSELAKIPGDRKHGKELFSKQYGCIACHQINGAGADFAPNLSEIGTKLGKEGLYEAIAYPSASIEFGYETTTFKLKNGDVKTGIITTDTPDKVVMKIVGGPPKTFDPADIQPGSRKRENYSLMPPLVGIGSQQDLVDLVEYLSALKKQ